MSFRDSRQAKALILGVNLGLLGLAVNLGMKSLDASVGHVRIIAPDARVAPLGAARQEFPPRKDAPSLKALLYRGRSFMARFDVRPEPKRKRAARIKRPKKGIARPVRGVVVGPRYKWGGIRLVGVVLNKKGKRYAIIESREIPGQVLLVEGQRLKGGPILRKVEADRVILEAYGERKVFRLVPKKTEERPRPRDRSVPAMARSRGSG